MFGERIIKPLMPPAATFSRDDIAAIKNKLQSPWRVPHSYDSCSCAVACIMVAANKAEYT